MDRRRVPDISEIVNPGRRTLRLNVHGHAAEIRCALPGVRQVAADLFADLLVDELPDGFAVSEGTIEAYDPDVVARSLSARADRVATLGDCAELWRDGERSWLLDDGWGLCEMNLLKRTWRSWVVPQAELDPVRVVEQAILWPMSQVIVPRGLAMVPAASIVHRGRGVLICSPFSLEPELASLLMAGHGLVGQRWTAVREEDGRPVLLQLPGRVERLPVPQLRSTVLPARNPIVNGPDWIDLSTDARTRCHYAWCDVVLLIEPGRRGQTRMTALTGASATSAVRRAWPMPDIASAARHGALATRLGQSCSVYQVELSRDSRALTALLDQIPQDLGATHPLKASLHTRDTRALAG